MCIYVYIKKRKRGKLFPKNEGISGRRAHTNTQKLNLNILTITYAFLDQKRVNVCEHMVKTAPCESSGKVPPGGCETGRGRSGALLTVCSHTFTLF